MTDRTGFSATDAALAGFEIARREPLTVLAWSAVQAVVVLPLSLVLGSAVAPYQAQLQLTGARDPAAAAALLSHVLPLELLAMVVLLALFAVLYAAVYRTVLHPAATGLGRLRLGADELRVAGALVLLFLVTVGAIVAGTIVAALAAGALSLAVPALRALWTVAAVLAVIAGLIFVGVRLSLSPPMTFATARVTVFGSWALTRGRFWPLFGTYLVAGLLALALEIAVLAVFAVLAFVLGGGMEGLQAMTGGGARSGGAGLALAILFQLGGALLSGFITALLAAAPAAAYGQLAGAAPAATPVPATPGSDLPRFGR